MVLLSKFFLTMAGHCLIYCDRTGGSGCSYEVINNYTFTSCFPSGTAQQFQSCHDATNCGGNVVTGVTTARDCCLGDGLSFQISGGCFQCIGK